MCNHMGNLSFQGVEQVDCKPIWCNYLHTTVTVGKGSDQNLCNMGAIVRTILFISLGVSFVSGESTTKGITSTTTPVVTSTALGTGQTKSSSADPPGTTTAALSMSTNQVSQNSISSPAAATSPASSNQNTTSTKPTTVTSSPKSPQGNTTVSESVTTANTSQTTPAQSTALPETVTTVNSISMTTQNGTDVSFPLISHGMDPGLVAVIVILVSLLVIAIVFTMIKYSNQGKQEFKRLHDLPMGNLYEDSPLVLYSV
uniref:Uncharacterized protein n=1 Tax=Callorhinchus milii TaxID=7868 RepID=A0A4W3H285_CALMI